MPENCHHHRVFKNCPECEPMPMIFRGAEAILEQAALAEALQKCAFQFVDGSRCERRRDAHPNNLGLPIPHEFVPPTVAKETVLDRLKKPTVHCACDGIMGVRQSDLRWIIEQVELITAGAKKARSCLRNDHPGNIG